MGDEFLDDEITGILDYRYGTWRVLPIHPVGKKPRVVGQPPLGRGAGLLQGMVQEQEEARRKLATETQVGRRGGGRGGRESGW